MENPYSQQYAQLESKALVAIVHTPDDYQPQAVRAAQAELAARGISSEEYERLFAEWQRDKLVPSKASFAHQRNSVIRGTTPLYNRMRQHWQSMGHIAPFAVITTLLALVSLWQNRWIVELWLIDDLKADIPTILLATEGVWLPTAAVLLWYKNKLGWSMMVIYICVSIILNLATFASILRVSCSAPRAITYFYPELAMDSCYFSEHHGGHIVDKIISLLRSMITLS